MAKLELGLFEDDPRATEGHAALRKLAAYGDSDETPDTQGHQVQIWFDYDAYDDPRVLATQEAVRDARAYEVYRQSGAWVMNPVEESELNGTNQ